ncbi:MAG: lipo-like protein [Gallionellales bacterium CG_4_10_14_3_um_filter_54_96]|nr:MAG: lipo-like protein [Gallionellaceae bacterium CG1_02_56_997]PIX05290.1 MAG: lipo-like protein [Gallionellales bacterium CG_4_8_14_3_um_filter_54_18]PIY06169.1 MAG: lipo-like protein [Gallionellales bacterium CG_4_10_14_3_um_filter_54_96]PJC03646.1 MAG: lipo-like protein [Gallionellales bacterium CG_4_9_14_0_8_um_filter_55_61]
MIKIALRPIGKLLAHYLNQPVQYYYVPAATKETQDIASVLQPGDVLLVEGNLRISAVIKYLTNSTWSHAALYVGTLSEDEHSADPRVLIEADLEHGVVAVPLSHYRGFHTRICRPVGLTETELQRVIDSVKAQIGHTYDLKNVFDLARYLIPSFLNFIPMRWRRRALSLGSGEPSKAICSTLIAQAFQLVHYPVLPNVEHKLGTPGCDACEREILHIRHHSLFTPRDFDISPFFEIVKPSIVRGFDYHTLQWDSSPETDEPPLTGE